MAQAQFLERFLAGEHVRVRESALESISGRFTLARWNWATIGVSSALVSRPPIR